MTNLNHCGPAPMTVGATGRYPVDPTAYRWPDMQPAVACSRLVCTECKAEVRAQAGYFLALDFTDRGVVPTRARALHASADWSTVAGVEASPSHRLYACQCFYYAEASASFTFYLDEDDGRVRQNLPWRCAGHPPLELPLVVDGRAVDSVAALTAVVEAATRDGARGAWVRDLFHRTRNGALEELVSDAVARVVAGPGPMGAVVAGLCAAETRLAPLSALFEELMQAQRSLATPDPVRRTEIAEILTHSVWQQPSGAPETATIAMLCDEAVRGVLTIGMLKMFSVFARDWMAANLAALIAAHPELAGAVLVWGGQATMWNHPDPEAAIAQLASIARASGLGVGVLRAQAEAALGPLMQLPNDRGPIVEVLAQLG